MDISNIFRPVLDRIASSIASTASYGIITRVLSSTGSFHDRTSLLHGAELAGPEQEDVEPTPPAQARESAAGSVTTAVDTFDIEAATPLQATSASDGYAGQQEPAAQDAESKRVGKSVQTVCLFAASASLVLFVNLPGRDDTPSKPVAGAAAAVAGEHGPGASLYNADLVFISLGFFSSLGLSMFSIMARPGEAAVAGVQKWGMVVAVASVLVAFALRLCMMPVA
jgi:hypothetical protein